ncbi:hypothetical protein GCM10027174_10430 [Salinifilum aidingensis]
MTVRPIRQQLPERDAGSTTGDRGAAATRERAGAGTRKPHEAAPAAGRARALKETAMFVQVLSAIGTVVALVILVAMAASAALPDVGEWLAARRAPARCRED